MHWYIQASYLPTPPSGYRRKSPIMLPIFSPFLPKGVSVAMKTVKVLFICLPHDKCLRSVTCRWLPTPCNGYSNNRKYVSMATKSRAVRFHKTTTRRHDLLSIGKTVGRNVSLPPVIPVYISPVSSVHHCILFVNHRWYRQDRYAL